MLKEFERESNHLIDAIRADLFACTYRSDVHQLLHDRRFVILHHMADRIKARFFGGRGAAVQFHPAVTHEDFVVGLSPETDGGNLRFKVRPGWLLEAAKQTEAGPYLLVIDEMNRADLGKVLGEAIYLFEPGEIGGTHPRTVQQPHPVDGQKAFAYPPNLYILSTMNTADRSIASFDLAVRRRFAFVTLRPDPAVLQQQKPPLPLRAVAPARRVPAGGHGRPLRRRAAGGARSD